MCDIKGGEPKPKLTSRKLNNAIQIPVLLLRPEPSLPEFYPKTDQSAAFLYETSRQNKRSSRQNRFVNFRLAAQLNDQDVTIPRIWLTDKPDKPNDVRQTLVMRSGEYGE